MSTQNSCAMKALPVYFYAQFYPAQPGCAGGAARGVAPQKSDIFWL